VSRLRRDTDSGPSSAAVWWPGGGADRSVPSRWRSWSVSGSCGCRHHRSAWSWRWRHWRSVWVLPHGRSRAERQKSGPPTRSVMLWPSVGGLEVGRARSRAWGSFGSTRAPRDPTPRSEPARRESGCSTTGPAGPSRRCWERRTPGSCSSATTTRRAASAPGRASWPRWHEKDRWCIACSGWSESFPPLSSRFPLPSRSAMKGLASPRPELPTPRWWKLNRRRRFGTRCSWR
jgi:hypothetical protein